MSEDNLKMIVNKSKPSQVKTIFIFMAGGNHWLGGVQYTRNLLRAVALLPECKRPQIIVRIPRVNKGKGYQKEFENYPNVVIDEPLMGTGKGFSLIWQRFIRKIHNHHLKHGSPYHIWRSDSCTVAFPIKSHRFNGPYQKVFWIPDFQYKKFPSFFSEKERKRRDKEYAKIFSKNSILVLSSKSVLNDFNLLFENTEKIQVRILQFSSVFNDEEFVPNPDENCRSYGIPDKFIYLPNQFFVHKGHETALDALKKLKNDGIEIPLVCTGSGYEFRNHQHMEKLHRIIQHSGIRDQVSFLGVLPRLEQVQIYRRAALILQPSLCEGWSTIVEDAKALGKTILLSDIDVHNEQSPDYGYFFKKGDSNSLARHLRILWPKCEPGVNLKMEKKAREESKLNAFRFAGRFMEIMNEAHSMYLETMYDLNNKHLLNHEG